ncbi:hypothetical protein DV515_00004766 [Chloebia gouldiae]|uniref:CP4B1 protein n=1 Tax=Chloebia gouldiae TaxID=44316 RepID=A0A3L8SP29_CHLGU|nr:hypothetical protein DV515_00004766 [Chloebia gouldiae]
MASLLDSITRTSAAILQLSVLFGVFFVLLKVLQLYWERKKLIKSLEAFPGPPKHWLYGHNHLIKSESFLHQVVSWGQEYPYAFPRWFGPTLPSIVIHHPEYAKTILGRADPKASAVYKLLVPWIGKGLLILEGSKWFQHRKMLTPAFHYDVLKSYVTLMSDSVKVMLDKWDKRITERRSVELFQDVSLMTLDTIMKSAFSFNSNCQTQSDSHYYIRAVFDLTYLLSNRIRNFSLQDVFYDFTCDGRTFQNACKLARTHTDQVIKERKMLLSNEKELEKIQKKRHLDFLDILLCSKDENGVGLSDEDLRAEVETFMFEGHDTVASALSWLFYCMNCIGLQFAMNEIKVALALTLQRFELYPDPSKLPIMMSQIILRSSNGIHLHLKKVF